MTVDFHPYVIELGLVGDEVQAALAELAVRPSTETASNAWLAAVNAIALVAKVDRVINEEARHELEKAQLSEE